MSLQSVLLTETGATTGLFRGFVPIQGGGVVPEQTLCDNIALTADTNEILYWEGARGPDDDHVRLTRAEGQDAFSGEDYRVIRIEGVEVTGPADSPRTMAASITITGPDGSDANWQSVLTETGVNTGHFTASRTIPAQPEPAMYWVVRNVQHGRQTGLGACRPFKLRVKGVPHPEEYVISLFGQDFDLEQGEDGFYYAEGGSDQVFGYIESDEGDNFTIVFFNRESRTVTRQTLPKSQKGDGAKAVLRTKSDVEKTIAQVGAQLVKISLLADLDQSGLADDKDLPFKRRLPKCIRPNDNVPNGERDDAQYDDDLIELKVKFDNGGKRVGQVWLACERPGDFEYYTNRAKATSPLAIRADIEKGEKLTETRFILCKGQFAQETNVQFVLYYGIYDPDPAKCRVWASDRLLLRVVRELGDPYYFWAARAYIMDNAAAIFVDKKQYGSQSVQIVIMREEATTMTALETYHVTKKLNGIDEVVAAHPDQTIVINGNFCDVKDANVKMTTKCFGRLIHGGTKSPASTDVGIGIEPIPKPS